MRVYGMQLVVLALLVANVVAEPFKIGLTRIQETPGIKSEFV